MLPMITLAEVIALIPKGSGLIAKQQGGSGNIQIMFESLGQMGQRDICRTLADLADTLVAKIPALNGTDPNELVKLSWRDKSSGEDVWKPFPQIWVNQPTEQEKASAAMDSAVTKNSAAIQKVANEMGDIKGMLQQLLGTAKSEPKNTTIQEAAPQPPPSTVTDPF